MSYIIDRLYLGDLEDVCDTEKLHANGISHILTVNSKPLYLEKREGFAYCHVQVLDMEDQDLLQHIPGCITFIAEGRERGAVMVHCAAGQSRSAAVVLAYVMSNFQLNLEEAARLVRKHRPQIQPNKAFWSQLQLFETMGNRVDPSHEEFKKYKLLNLATKMKFAQGPDSLPEDALASDPSLAPVAGQTVYKCKKCRRPLFKLSALLSHEVGKGEAAFDWRARVASDDGHDQGGTCNQSLFIEPVHWMARDILELQGKICCPKCNAKLGSFDWTGERCPCGTWVIPSFHIQTSKVDEARPRAAGPPIIAPRSRLIGPARQPSTLPSAAPLKDDQDPLTGEARSAGAP